MPPEKYTEIHKGFVSGYDDLLTALVVYEIALEKDLKMLEINGEETATNFSNGIKKISTAFEQVMATK